MVLVSAATGLNCIFASQFSENHLMPIKAQNNAAAIPILIEEAPPASRFASFLIRRAFEAAAARPIEDREDIRWLISHPEAPEDLLLSLCDQGLYLDVLGHRQGPRALLEKMAAQHRYPEAVVTLGKRLYADPQESTESLRAFLDEFRDSAWLFESLARTERSSAEKEQIFLNMARTLPFGDTVRAAHNRRQQESRAAQATDATEIQTLYETRDPAVWRALANNPHTPEDVVRRLAEVGEIKFARDIRNLAQANLSRRRRS
jgi:hypothetical protein